MTTDEIVGVRIIAEGGGELFDTLDHSDGACGFLERRGPNVEGR